MADLVRVSLEEVVAQTGIELQRLKQECCDEDILIFASFCDSWNLIGQHLKLTKAQISAIDGDYRTTEEKRVAALQKWKEAFAYKATYQALVESFLSCNMTQQACDICKYLKVKRKLGEHSVMLVAYAKLANKGCTWRKYVPIINTCDS